jgi:hypothetical protein
VLVKVASLRRPAVLLGVVAPVVALLAVATVLFVGGDRVTSPAVYPNRVLNLRAWELTVPYAGPDGRKRANVVRQPCLVSACFDAERVEYANTAYQKPFTDGWFRVTDDAAGVVFRAPVDGATTKGSKNVRTELRELAGTEAGGAELLANWSNKKGGVHTMDFEGAITATPRHHPAVVCAQVDDKSGEVLMVTLLGKRLFVRGDRDDFAATLDPDYRLASRFTLRIEAAHKSIRVTYDGKKTVTFKRASGSMYFRAGAYNQSNRKQYKNESPRSYGEVVIYKLKVGHVGAPAAVRHEMDRLKSTHPSPAPSSSAPTSAAPSSAAPTSAAPSSTAPTSSATPTPSPTPTASGTPTSASPTPS